MRFLIVTSMRNEGAFLLEWLAHHRAAGVDHFLVYSNDCEDGTEAMLDRLAALGWLTHVPNPGPHPKGPQWEGLRRADRHPLVAGAEWVLVSDVDEFVCVKVGDHTLRALVDAQPEATAFTLTWRMFGNAGLVDYRDAPVTETFTRAAPAVLHWPWRAAMFKTLFRNDGSYGKLGVHRPRQPDRARLEAARWVDGSGRPLSGNFLTNRVFSDFGQDNYGLVQLNHYALGSMESFVVKRDRGRANRGGEFDLGYWVERNFSAVEDGAAEALGPARRALLAELRADPELGPLHDAAAGWRKRRFEALMQDEAMRTLFGQLLLTPPTRVLDAGEAEAVMAHARRAQVRGRDGDRDGGHDGTGGAAP
ncbi:glycosyltransferase family 2 protein [Acidimangrovimonas sediminis]|uniref:glycosyltransferase family 2 protein n=1 Tax=Acidimangrovimonas sediminis TaxID=2056283 RepID=UPI001E5AE7EF|nr:glycosyltransferase family 2 protein [Acidimangrovimonas sediminis]